LGNVTKQIAAHRLTAMPKTTERRRPTARGLMDPELRYQAPFTDVDRNGLNGVFEQADAVRLVQILRDIEPRVAA
jgi:hypothetical protein